MVKKSKVAVLKSSGTNCDNETKIAFELAGGNAKIVHTQELYAKKKSLDSTVKLRTITIFINHFFQ